MGLSLTLIVEKHPNLDRILAENCLTLSFKDEDVFDRIKAEAIPLQEIVQWCDEEEGLTDRDTDGNGEKLTCIAAHTLSRHLSEAELGAWDAAVLAFLKALLPSTRIVLWWQ